MKTLKILLILILVSLVAAATLVYGGFADVAADSPHGGFVTRVLNEARERAIARQSAGIVVPGNLKDAKFIASGAGEYAEMCSGCHLAPGMEDGELRVGLYPRPPELSSAGTARAPAQQFWIIKHGIKMTGMPAWGPTHEDERLWSIVAFLQKLPGMSAADYQALVGSGEGGHHHHDETGEAGEEHEHAEQGPAPAAAATLAGVAGEAGRVVDDFQAKLAHGAADDAARLLSPSLLVFEGGETEASRAEYASHHLKADADFLKSAQVKPLARRGGSAGDLAWVATESEILTHGAKPVSLVSTETMVLERTPQGWRIAHIHWSSRRK